jgi:type II secretory pathway component GspD/PulD (secretin)
MKFAKVVLGVAIGVMLSGSGVWAQTTPTAKTGTDATPVKTDTPARVRMDYSTLPLQTFYLTNVSAPNEANEIQTAIRNMLPADARVIMTPAQNAIMIRGTADDFATAAKIIKDLDRPKKIYRLTYTVSEMDGAKRLSSQRFTMMLADGQRMTLKQGSKVPIATGSIGTANAPASSQTQFQYLDVGMNFDSTLSSVAGGAVMKTKVEQSSVAETTTIAQVQEPVIRQTSLEGTSVLTAGKPLTLGSLDIPGSTRHLDVEVMMELMP